MVKKPRSEYTKDPSEIAPEDASSNEAEVNFDERNGLFMNPFSEVVEEQKPKAAIAIVMDTETGKPYVYQYGHIYDIGCLTAHILRMLKAEMARDLSA